MCSVSLTLRPRGLDAEPALAVAPQTNRSHIFSKWEDGRNKQRGLEATVSLLRHCGSYFGLIAPIQGLPGLQPVRVDSVERLI